MKLTGATNYMAELSSELETINKLLKDLLSLSNVNNIILVTLEEEEVGFSKEIILNALQEQRKSLYMELTKTHNTISKLLEEK